MEAPVNRIILGAALGVFACNAPPPAQAPTPDPAAAAVAAQEPEPAAPGPAGPAAPAVPAAPRPDLAGTVAGVASASKDHTTLVAALQAADLVGVVGSPGGAYTVFAPTNDAFAKLPPGTVEALLKPEKKGDLRNILLHHAGVPVMTVDDMNDGGSLAMADGKRVTFSKKDGKVSVDGANIVASVRASNGIVHVVDAVIVPGAAK